MKPENKVSFYHPFWGEITDGGNVFTPDFTFAHPFFCKKEHRILLGEQGIQLTPVEEKLNPGQFYRPLEEFINKNLLDEFALTYTHFVNHIEENLLQLQEISFKFYQKYLSKYYAEEDVLKTLEAHNDYIKDLAFIRVTKGKSITLTFYYNLISTPVHYIEFVDGVLDNIHGEKIEASTF